MGELMTELDDPSGEKTKREMLAGVIRETLQSVGS